MLSRQMGEVLRRVEVQVPASGQILYDEVHISPHEYKKLIEDRQHQQDRGYSEHRDRRFEPHPDTDQAEPVYHAVRSHACQIYSQSFPSSSEPYSSDFCLYDKELQPCSQVYPSRHVECSGGGQMGEFVQRYQNVRDQDLHGDVQGSIRGPQEIRGGGHVAARQAYRQKAEERCEKRQALQNRIEDELYMVRFDPGQGSRRSAGSWYFFVRDSRDESDLYHSGNEVRDVEALSGGPEKLVPGFFDSPARLKEEQCVRAGLGQAYDTSNRLDPNDPLIPFPAEFKRMETHPSCIRASGHEPHTVQSGREGWRT